jgi:hypothetical protein
MKGILMSVIRISGVCLEHRHRQLAVRGFAPPTQTRARPVHTVANPLTCDDLILDEKHLI